MKKSPDHPGLYATSAWLAGQPAVIATTSAALVQVQRRIAMLDKLQDHAIEAAVINASGKVAGAGGLTAVGSGVAGKYTQAVAQSPEIAQAALQWADIGVMAGIALGVAGYVTQLVFQWRRDRRESRLHKHQMEK